MKKSYAVASVSIAAVMAVGGCSSAASPSAEPPSSTASAVNHVPVLTNYFDAFATDRAAEMAPMLTNSEPGSPAYLYAQHQINAATASESANSSPAPSTITVTQDSVTLLSQLPNEPTEQQKIDATNVYSSFEYAPSGLITAWTADPGGPLAPRISAQSSKVTSAKVTVALKTAYATNSGDLSVTFDVTNKSGKKANVTITGYINPDGRQVKVVNTPYAADPAPGSFSTSAASVVSGQRGGKLIVQFDYQTDKKLPVS